MNPPTALLHQPATVARAPLHIPRRRTFGLTRASRFNARHNHFPPQPQLLPGASGPAAPLPVG